MDSAKSYILGLWFSSGRIYHDNYYVISVKKKDKYILNKIAQELQCDKPIISNGITYISFSSLDIIALQEFPKKFLQDFIRGYFDGRGEIKRISRNRINTSFFCWNKRFADWLLHVLKEEAGVEGGSYDSFYRVLKFGKRDSLRIGNYIYQNNPELFLERKRKKFYL